MFADIGSNCKMRCKKGYKDQKGYCETGKWLKYYFEKRTCRKKTMEIPDSGLQEDFRIPFKPKLTGEAICDSTRLTKEKTTLRHMKMYETNPYKLIDEWYENEDGNIFREI